MRCMEDARSTVVGIVNPPVRLREPASKAPPWRALSSHLPWVVGLALCLAVWVLLAFLLLRAFQ